jgi:hypothetical protein
LMDSTVLRYCFSRRSLRLPNMALRALVSTGDWRVGNAKTGPSSRAGGR